MSLVVPSFEEPVALNPSGQTLESTDGPNGSGASACGVPLSIFSETDLLPHKSGTG